MAGDVDIGFGAIPKEVQEYLSKLKRSKNEADKQLAKDFLERYQFEDTATVTRDLLAHKAKSEKDKEDADKAAFDKQLKQNKKSRLKAQRAWKEAAAKVGMTLPQYLKFIETASEQDIGSFLYKLGNGTGRYQGTYHGEDRPKEDFTRQDVTVPTKEEVLDRALKSFSGALSKVPEDVAANADTDKDKDTSDQAYFSESKPEVFAALQKMAQDLDISRRTGHDPSVVEVKGGMELPDVETFERGGDIANYFDERYRLLYYPVIKRTLGELEQLRDNADESYERFANGDDPVNWTNGKPRKNKTSYLKALDEEIKNKQDKLTKMEEDQAAFNPDIPLDDLISEYDNIKQELEGFKDDRRKALNAYSGVYKTNKDGKRELVKPGSKQLLRETLNNTKEVNPELDTNIDYGYMGELSPILNSMVVPRNRKPGVKDVVNEYGDDFSNLEKDFKNKELANILSEYEKEYPEEFNALVETAGGDLDDVGEYVWGIFDDNDHFKYYHEPKPEPVDERSSEDILEEALQNEEDPALYREMRAQLAGISPDNPAGYDNALDYYRMRLKDTDYRRYNRVFGKPKTPEEPTPIEKILAKHGDFDKRWTAHRNSLASVLGNTMDSDKQGYALQYPTLFNKAIEALANDNIKALDDDDAFEIAHFYKQNLNKLLKDPNLATSNPRQWYGANLANYKINKIKNEKQIAELRQHIKDLTQRKKEIEPLQQQQREILDLPDQIQGKPAERKATASVMLPDGRQIVTFAHDGVAASYMVVPDGKGKFKVYHDLIKQPQNVQDAAYEEYKEALRQARLDYADDKKAYEEAAEDAKGVYYSKIYSPNTKKDPLMFINNAPKNIDTTMSKSARNKWFASALAIVDEANSGQKAENTGTYYGEQAAINNAFQAFTNEGLDGKSIDDYAHDLALIPQDKSFDGGIAAQRRRVLKSLADKGMYYSEKTKRVFASPESAKQEGITDLKSPDQLRSEAEGYTQALTAERFAKMEADANNSNKPDTFHDAEGHTVEVLKDDNKTGLWGKSNLFGAGVYNNDTGKLNLTNNPNDARGKQTTAHTLLGNYLEDIKNYKKDWSNLSKDEAFWDNLKKGNEQHAADARKWWTEKMEGPVLRSLQKIDKSTPAAQQKYNELYNEIINRNLKEAWDTVLAEREKDKAASDAYTNAQNPSIADAGMSNSSYGKLEKNAKKRVASAAYKQERILPHNPTGIFNPADVLTSVTRESANRTKHSNTNAAVKSANKRDDANKINPGKDRHVVTKSSEGF